MRAIPSVVGYALQESIRRRVFVVVLLLTAGFLVLYWLGVRQTYANIGDIGGRDNVEPVELAGATLLGLGMFGTLFLGTVLAVFLTLGAVGGDAERGLLQPLVVRPVSRSSILVARFLGAAGVCVLYVFAVFTGTLVITGLVGHWWPDRFVEPALGLGAAVALLTAISLLGSVYLSSTANGIAVFMIFGGGLVAGLLGQIGRAIDSSSLETASDVASGWLLPFEGLYQTALAQLTADSDGATQFVVRLGPFGGGESRGVQIIVWSLVYLAVVAVTAIWGFRRRDL